MIVCLCFGIKLDTIKELIKEDKTLEEITLSCGAGSDCGSCLKVIKNEIYEYNKNKDRK